MTIEIMEFLRTSANKQLVLLVPIDRQLSVALALLLTTHTHTHTHNDRPLYRYRQWLLQPVMRVRQQVQDLQDIGSHDQDKTKSV